MIIKYIDFGGEAPNRAHKYDAGADVFSSISMIAKAHSVTAIPLGIGLVLPENTVAYIMPRSGITTKQHLIALPVPVDSGYQGEVHAIIQNATDKDISIPKGTKIAQIVIMPILTPAFIKVTYEELQKTGRGKSAFGSTGDSINELKKTY